MTIANPKRWGVPIQVPGYLPPHALSGTLGARLRLAQRCFWTGALPPSSDSIMTQKIRLFMLLDGAAFASAALTHFGVLIDGYEHQKAGAAESVIAIVLLAGL